MKRFRLASLLIASLLAAAAGWSQTVTGRISGRVQDATGAVAPGAEIKVSNEGTQRAWNVKTDDKGDYLVPDLPPGMYRVTAAKAGFAGFTRSGIDLAVDARITVDFTLKVGDTTQSVEVRASGEMVNSVSGEISRTIDSAQVDRLALNGRNYLQTRHPHSGFRRAVYRPDGVDHQSLHHRPGDQRQPAEHQQPFGGRVVQPRLREQWFADQ